MKGLLPKAQLFLKRNSSTILTVVGAVGVVATSVLTAKATIKAIDLLAEAEDAKQEELTMTEVVKTAAPAYVPAVLTGAATITCIFGANVLNKRQQATLMSAYALLDRTYKDYKGKVIELFGEEADYTIRDAVEKDYHKEIDISVSENKQLFYDSYSMRHFESTMDEVLNAERVFAQCVETGYACINDFYQLLGIDPIKHGNDFGWFAYTEGVKFNHEKVIHDDGLEVYIIEISTDPVMY